MIKYYREKGIRLDNDLWSPEDRGYGSGWGEVTRAEVAELWRLRTREIPSAKGHQSYLIYAEMGEAEKAF